MSNHFSRRLLDAIADYYEFERTIEPAKLAGLAQSKIDALIDTAEQKLQRMCRVAGVSHILLIDPAAIDAAEDLILRRNHERKRAHERKNRKIAIKRETQRAWADAGLF